ncbi:hypothetical protein [Lysobacter antibioticus]|uniref:hypothetical protein n=1 Tax=Lysobacter antibioticus TaxID=84531 RepID=UPI000716EBE4|nr:hypothetical protein [Lysobacter antibioticus]
MTWYADEIVLRASDEALESVAASPWLAPFAYHIRSLAGHVWHRKELRHGLPDGGLLVIRPVCGKSSHWSDWHHTEVLDWTGLPCESAAEELLDTEVTQCLSEYLDEESVPPLQLRRAVATLAAGLRQPVFYYGCAMWGGDIEHEYSLVYGPEESIVLTNTIPHIVEPPVDALRAGLHSIGLELPTGYFAPHTRSFPWQAHKLRQ